MPPPPRDISAELAAEVAALRAKLLSSESETANRIVVDEADTRIIIDAQLTAAGWQADSSTLRHARGTRPAPGRATAIAEWPTESGSVDYALFLDGRCVGAIEAKRSGLAVPAAVDQAKRYARTIRLEPDEAAFGTPYAHGLDEAYRVPFVFATNGRPCLEQFETQSGIWSRDARRATNWAVAPPDWFTPRDLAEWLEQELDAAGFSEDLPDLPDLRAYQAAAIAAVEEAVAAGRRESLVAMATGTGKTLTEMRPVMADPKLGFADLMRDLARAPIRRIGPTCRSRSWRSSGRG